MSNFKYKIQKLRNMPLKTLTKKIVIKGYDNLYYNWKEKLLTFKPIDISNKYFEGFSSETPFLFNTNDKRYYVEQLKILNGEKKILEDAEKICSHNFNLLGSGDIYLGEQIPWNSDFKVNFTWKNRYYKKIKTVDLSNSADVKVPWELSRFQHIFTLGKAYWITKNEKYAVEFRNQIEDWIKNNPVEMSVNWTSAMDIAIRAVNWICGYHFFSDSPSISEGFWEKFNKYLYLHGEFIFGNLENKYQHTGNHYLSDIVGLIFIGLYFKNFKCNDKEIENKPQQWLEYGIFELKKEMFIQVNEDGTNYEASTSYHRLVTELFLVTTILCCKNNINFTDAYLNRLEKMCEFIMHITQPNGRSPLIGDADDGRLIIFSQYSTWPKDDFRHLLSISGEFFDRDDFRYFGDEYREDVLWILHKYKKTNSIYDLTSREFKEGGYYILREENIYCCIRCGELSFRGDGVHSHNDQLSFTLNVGQEDIFIDPGAFIYTGDYKSRNVFRSTMVHNTLAVKGYEQNNFDKYNLFYMKEQTFSKCLEFDNHNFIGKHNGYIDKCNVMHQRDFLLSKKYLKIKDQLVGETRLEYKLNFTLDPDVTIKIEEDKVYIFKNKVKILVEFTGYPKLSLEDTYISNGYGVKRKSKSLKVEHNISEIETYIKFLT